MVKEYMGIPYDTENPCPVLPQCAMGKCVHQEGVKRFAERIKVAIDEAIIEQVSRG